MKLTVSQYVVFLAKPILLAMISGLIFTFLINPANAVFQVSEVAISIYIQVMFLGFIFFSALLLVRVDEEWKKTHEAILKKDFNLFKLESPKRIPASATITYALVTIFAATSFYFFHYESELLGLVITTGTSFISLLIALVVFDLDDPINGFIVVENVPKAWLEKLVEK